MIDLPTIRVDADACPAQVRFIIERYARRRALPLLFYLDDSHELEPAYGEIRRVGKGRDAVDLVLINQTLAGDLVVTQDYGLAALALARRAKAIHPSGMIFNDHNIDQLLMERYFSARARQAGERTGHPRKRKQTDDWQFDKQLKRLLED